MKSGEYILEVFDDDNGVKSFRKSSNNLIIWDVPIKEKEFLRDEIEKNSYQQTGVYFLINKMPKEEKCQIYIGESDSVVKRVFQHIAAKDKQFNRCVVFYQDANYSKLGKDQIRYLEKKLISHFKSISSKWINKNKEEGKNIRLSSFEKRKMNGYFEFILYAMKIFDYEVKKVSLEPKLRKIINDAHNYENPHNMKDENENSREKHISVWMKNWHEDKKVFGEYKWRNFKTGKILINEETYFDFKMRVKGSKGRNWIVSELKKYKKEGKIDFNSNADLINEPVKIKIIKDSLFQPSLLSTFLSGKWANKYDSWKGSNNKTLRNYLTNLKNIDADNKSKLDNSTNNEDSQETNLSQDVKSTSRDKKEIVNENELIDVWIQTGFDKETIRAKFINNGDKESILFDKDINFIFKLKSVDAGVKKSLESTLIKQKEKNNIEYDGTFDLSKDQFNVKIFKGARFAPSGISRLLKGRTSNGNDEWKDNNNIPILKYIKNRGKDSNKLKENNYEHNEDLNKDTFTSYSNADFSKVEKVVNRKGVIVKTQVYFFNRANIKIKKLYKKLIDEIRTIWPNCSIKYNIHNWYVVGIEKIVEFYFNANEIVIQLDLKNYQKSNIFEIRDVSKIGRQGTLGSRIKISSHAKVGNKEIEELARLFKISHKNATLN